MTFRSDEDALRERIAELEKIIADSKPVEPEPRFEILRGPKRLFWWLMQPFELQPGPMTFREWFAVSWLMCTVGELAAAGLLRGRFSIFFAILVAINLGLMLLRLWLRSAMALDQEASREAWAKRFE